jgi:signal transduction histidine kinase
VVTYASESIPLYATSECLILLLAFLILFIRTDILHESKYRNEMKIMNQVLAAESNQYESLKENIASINMKAHDIKHQLEHYQDKLTEEEVNELKKSVSAYDKRIDTGSQVLDTVLYFSELTCDKEKITISCLADGKPLNEIEDSKVYYLFNNIIGNAIEATSKVSDPSKRLISLHVYQKDNDMVIEESNYFTGSIVLKGNRIPSSKEEKKGHGYGLKSIALIVSSNGGKENIHTEGDMFFMSISLPLPQNKKKADEPLNAK